MDRASVFGTEGWGFESLQARPRAVSSAVEHLPLKQGVTGSNPVRLTKNHLDLPSEKKQSVGGSDFE